MIILELSDIQLTKQANSAGLLRWQACRKIEVTQGPSRTGSFSHSTQLVNSDDNIYGYFGMCSIGSICDLV